MIGPASGAPTASRRRATLVGALSLLLAACGEPDPPAAIAPIVRDSGGIVIVENVAPVWNDETAWRLSDTPVLQLGAGADGDVDQQFASIRSVRFMPDSTVLVADAANFELAFFDLRKRRVRSAGGDGRGPGELGPDLMRNVLRCTGDTIFVSGYDRVTVYTPAGEYVRTFRPQAPRGIAVPRWCVGNHLLTRTRHGPRPTSPGAYRDSMVIGLYSTDGDFLGSSDPLPSGDGSWIRNAEGLGYYWTPFGRHVSLATTDYVMAMGIGDAFEVTVRDAAGVVRRIIRAAGEARPIAPADVERYREFVFSVTSGPELRQQIEAELETPDGPATLPAFAELIFDEAGNLWARRYDHFDAIAFFNDEQLPGTTDVRVRDVPDTPRTWTVFDPTGALLGNVVTTPGFVVHEIGDDWMIGVWRDSLDVEHVRMYRIVKPRA